MTIYDKLGVTPIINADGPLTRYGGALMDKATLDAMDEASRYSVPLDKLQAAASAIIAEKTHAEAGIVTGGACAALTLATAACICGYDLSRMEKLPDTADMPNEVIMPWHQISGYDHAIRAAGARLIGVGIPHATVAPFVVHPINKWHIEAMISEKTAAIAYAVRTGSHPPLEEVIAVGKRYGIPVIIDSAPEIPPIENLYRFIDMGADLVCVSGGKGIRGPQNSGILYGRKDLIASAAVQMLEAPSESYENWSPPETLIPKEKFRGVPTQGIGRGLKVSKETIIGLLTALGNLDQSRFSVLEKKLNGLLETIKKRVESVPGVAAYFIEPQYCLCSYPTLELKLDEDALGICADEVCRRLRKDNIYLRDRYVSEGKIRVFSMNLDEASTKRIEDALMTSLTSGRR